MKNKYFFMTLYQTVLKIILHIMFNFLLMHGKFNMNDCAVAIQKLKIYEILDGLKNFKKSANFASLWPSNNALGQVQKF